MRRRQSGFLITVLAGKRRKLSCFEEKAFSAHKLAGFPAGG